MPLTQAEKNALTADGGYQTSQKDRQTIAITDIISEGPIYGLVDGAASVYLNDDRVVPLAQAASFYSQSAAAVSLVNGSATATITGAGTTPVIEADSGDKYLIVRAGRGAHRVNATDGSAGTDDYNITATLTAVDTGGSNTASSFFVSSMVSSPADLDTHVPARLGIINTGGVGDGAYGEGFISKRISGSVAEYVPGAGAAAGIWIPDGSYNLEVDRIVKIASISGVTVTLAAVWPGTTASYKFDVTGAIVTNADVITQTATANYEGITTQFRVGTLAQTPFSGRGGESGATSISNSPSAGGTLEQTTGFGSGSQAAKTLIASASAGFNLTASQIQEVDEARITFAYAGGLHAIGGKGSDEHSFAQYKIDFALKRPGESSFETAIVLKQPMMHSGMYKNAVTFVETIDLAQYRPFSDFKVIISRITNHEGPGYKKIVNGTPETFHDWTNVTQSSITNTTCVIKDILTHPYSALARVTFDTKKFQGMPTRSYHIRGLKVKVPSNYVTREQDSNGIANYMRNPATGLIAATYQDWDGGFALHDTYTNNPAWVFYDVLTNNRYGLGDFLKATDIDKYALYRIARYCDELVDDGKGGLEPRFTANLFFAKAADAYKVLKDIATVFRSMLYFIDGQVFPVIDSPSGPVYNFTKGNVIDGAFSYEGTGSKTRINQCIVTWIDPDANYKASPLIVEDRLNIAKTGVIISQDAMAMGATSEGQALRYGRWKLWTAANQREIVSFSTSLNASFILPGDIVNVQDADRYAVRISGRISNTGTDRSTTSIPLDSTTSLIANSDYDLSVIFVEPGAFATDTISITDNAGTPVTTTYNKGDIIKKAWIDDNGNGTYTYQLIDTETKAINAKATATNTEALVLSWANTTRVETQPVSTSAGAVDTLTVSTAFSAVPAAESIWVLTEKINTINVLGSAKQYKILSISQGAKNDFSMTGVEHYDEKFAAVDEDFTTYIADSIYPAVRHNDVVPPVLDVFGESIMNPNLIGEELTIQWTPPTNVGDVAGIYEHLSGYEITHTFPNIESPVFIDDKSQTNWKIEGIMDGTYEVAVRAVNVLQNVSAPTTASITVSDRYRENVPRMPEGVPYGGTTSVGFGLLSSSFIFKRYQYSVKAPGGESTRITNTTTSSAAWQQSCATLPVISWSESNRNAAGEFIREHAYIMIDASDSTDRLKLVKYHRPASSKGYWYDMGSGNSAKYGSALTGTFSKAAGTSKVTGSGTAFLTQLQDGDVLKLDSTEGYKVAAVVSDTVLYVTNSYGSYSGVSGYIPNLRIDYANDFIIARVYRNSGGLVLAESYTKIDAVLKPAGDMVEAGGVGTEEIAENAVTVTEIDTSAATGGTFGAAVAALDAASFTSIDTDVLDANSVIAREVQVFPVGGTAPTISGTTLAGAGIDLKQDGDLYVGNAAANKYMFWDQSEGVMTFRGTLNAGDITAGTITADRIAVGSLDADKITANTITADEIAAGAITTATLAADAITAEKIATNAITADAIAAGTITATEISTGAITATKVAADAITASKINVANLASINANIGAITAGTIKGNTVPDANAAPSGAETGAFLDLTAGKMVFGNSTKHILWDGTNLTISGVTIDSATLTNSSGSFVTQADINTSINALIDGAPGTLNTLNELAAALDDDADFHTAVTTGLNARLPLTGGAMSGAITTNSTFDGRNVSVDGTKLDGIAAGATNTATPYYTGAIPNATASATGLATSTQITKLDGIAAGATNVTNNNQLTNGAGYITNADDGDAATFGGSLPSAYVKTDQAQALGSQANAMTISGSTITLRRGDGTTDTVTTPNTTYSVGDGGLTQNNFTNADHTKLNGIAASANNYSFPYTVSANAGNSTVVQRHSSGYIFANYFNTTPNTVTSGVTQVCVETGNDGYIRHGTPAAIRTFINVADGANNYTHPNDGVDYGAANTGANIISDVAVNALGHVTGFSTRALTLANLGYTGDSDANNLVPAVTSNGSSPSLGTGISAAEMRTVIGAGTSNLAIGTTSSTAMAGNTAIGATTAQANAIIANTAKTGITSAQASAITANTAKTGITSAQASAITANTAKTSFPGFGTTSSTALAGNTSIPQGTVTTINETGSALTVANGTSATVTLSAHANLEAIATGVTSGNMSVDFLEADVIVANHITANTIDAGMLTVGNSSNASTSRLLLLEDSLKIFSGSALRVHIGNLSNTDDGT
jgi:predicted phage tail protein